MSNLKKIVYTISFCLLIFVFIYLVVLTNDSKKIIEVKEFIKSDIKVLYIYDKTEDEKIVELLKKYSIEYMDIDSNKLTIFEKKKLKSIINNTNIKNTLVLYENGKIMDYLINCNSNKKAEKLLQKNEIIPKEIVDNIKEIEKQSLQILDGDYSIVYIPYIRHDNITNQEKILKNIAEKYEIEYKQINAYSLSKIQKTKINKLLEISDVEDQIVVVVKNKKMIANIRGIHSKNTYVENLYDLNFIDELENKIKEISYDEFKNKLTEKEKSIIFIGMNNSIDCEKVFNLLNGMIYNYGLNINYINLQNTNSSIYLRVKTKIEKMGYKGNFTLPLVLIVESNKILDYVIGNSQEDYFLEIFIENGVIRGDEINE